MCKKKILLAFTVLSVAMSALPVAASAQEAHIEGWSNFTGIGGASTWGTSGEPTWTVESTDINGVVQAGGTTGSMSLDLTGCHIMVLGFTLKCRTAGSPKDNTVSTDATFHVITYNNTPALLVTPNAVTISTGGASFSVEGNGLIGTITSPACSVESKTMTVNFAATGSSQNDMKYTGVDYDLKAKTSGGSQVTTAMTQEWTFASATQGKINCT